MVIALRQLAIKGMNPMKIIQYIWAMGLFLAVIAVWQSGAAFAENIDPDDIEAQFAWGENAGWLNAEPDGQGGPGLTVTGHGVTGFVWAENLGWISFSCENTSSCGVVDFGVTNDGHGNLGGYAWGENIGWISLSCDNTDSCGTADYGVSIDGATGQFFGQAWSENVGWIAFDPFPMAHDGVITDWTAKVCVGDTEPDGDVDGVDLRAYAMGGSFGDLGSFAGEFGRFCPF